MAWTGRALPCPTPSLFRYRSKDASSLGCELSDDEIVLSFRIANCRLCSNIVVFSSYDASRNFCAVSRIPYICWLSGLGACQVLPHRLGQQNGGLNLLPPPLPHPPSRCGPVVSPRVESSQRQAGAHLSPSSYELVAISSDMSKVLCFAGEGGLEGEARPALARHVRITSIDIPSSPVNDVTSAAWRCLPALVTSLAGDVAD